MKRFTLVSTLLGLVAATLPLKANAQFLFGRSMPEYPPYSSAKCATALQQWEQVKQPAAPQRSSQQIQKWITLGFVLEDCQHFEEARAAYRFAQTQPSANQSFVIRTLVKQQKLDEAVNLSRDLWKRWSDRQTMTDQQIQARALDQVGVILARNDQLSLAQSYFKQANQSDPTFYRPHRNLGELYVKQNQLELATKAFEQELNISIPSLSATRLQAMAVLRVASALQIQGDRPNATRWFQKAIQLDPQYDISYLRLSEYQMEQKRYDHALKTLEQLRQINPSNSQVHNSLGFIYVIKGDYDQAIAHYKEAIQPFQHKLTSPKAYVHNTLGHQLHSMGRYEAASMAFRVVSQAEPTQVLTYFFQAESLALMEQWESAIEVFNQAKTVLKANPKSRPSLDLKVSLALAQALAKVDRVEEAKELLSPFLEIRAKDPTLHKTFGDLYSQEGNFSAANASFIKSIENRGFWWIKTTPEAKVHAAQGQALLDLERYEAAIPHFEKAIAADPEFAWAYAALGKSYRYLNRLEDSVEAYEKAIQISPRDKEYTHSFFSGLGVTLLAQNKLEDASQSLQQALIYNDKNVEAQYGLGQTKLQQGKVEDAIAAFKRVLEIRPHHMPAFSDLLKAKKLLSSQS